jgi:hypothetical protein
VIRPVLRTILWNVRFEEALNVVVLRNRGPATSPDSCENPMKRSSQKTYLKEYQPLCEIDLCEMGFI